MKFKNLLILFFLFLNFHPAYSAEEKKLNPDFTIDSQALDSFSKKNPFQSLLPKKTVIQKTPPIINEIKPVKTPIQQPVVIKPPSPPILTISGIIWNTQRPQAIINGQVVDQGDIIEGAQIVSIKKSSIDLIFQNINFSIKP